MFAFSICHPKMLIFRGFFFHKNSNNVENINRKHFRCCRKLQLWRVFHIVLADDWVRLLPIQTSKSTKRRNVSDSTYPLLSGMKCVKNRYFCLLCFHWQGNRQMHSCLKTAESHSPGSHECGEGVSWSELAVCCPSLSTALGGLLSVGRKCWTGRASLVLLSEAEHGLLFLSHQEGCSVFPNHSRGTSGLWGHLRLQLTSQDLPRSGERWGCPNSRVNEAVPDSVLLAN